MTKSADLKNRPAFFALQNIGYARKRGHNKAKAGLLNITKILQNYYK
jgi:hypothetical protein